MSTTSKRLFSIFLTVCLLLSMAVPAVFAEEGVLNYSFTTKDGTAASQMAILTWGDSVSACTIYNDGAGIPTPDYPESSSPWAYAGRSLSGKLKTDDGNRVVIKQGYTQVFFSEKSATSGTNGDWMALKLVNVPAGTYKMTFTSAAGTGAGLADVFVMPYSEYSAIDAAYTSLTQENAAEVYPLVNDGMKTLLADKAPLGVLDSNCADPQIMGLYTCQTAGDYILVFRCSAGQSAKEDSRLYVSALEMAPASAVELVEAQIAALGEITAESEAAVSAARAAYNALTDDQKALVSNYETLTAAEEIIAGLKTRSYTFKSSSAIKIRTTGDTTSGAYFDPNVPAPGLMGGSLPWSFAGRSLNGQTGSKDGSRVDIGGSGLVVHFSQYNAQSLTNEDWIALKLTDVAAGTYTLNFAGPAHADGDLADVFMMPESEYAGVYESYTALNADAVNTGMKTLLENKEPVGTFDSKTGEAQAIGIYTCAEAGDYVLVFRCGGTSTKHNKLSLLTLEMTATNPAELVDALIDEIGTVTAESGAAIKAARDAYIALDAAQKAEVTKFDVLAAADEAYAAMNQLSYVFKSRSGAIKVRTWGDSAATYTEPAFPEMTLSNASRNWSFVGRSLSGKTGSADGSRVDIGTSTLIAYFSEVNAASSTNGDWIALKLTDVPAGEFKLILTSEGNTERGGISDVFMIPASEYAGIYESYLSLSEENAETVRAAVNAGMKTLLSDKEMVGTFDSTKRKAQTVGVYNCAEAGDYVLVFRCSAGQTKNNWLNLLTMEMKYPTILDTVNAAQIGNQTYASLEAALAAVENGDVLTMNSDATVSELVVPAGASLDLNGYALTAESLSTVGSIVDSSEGNVGVLKAADLEGISAFNSELPLYDNAVEGYRFFKATLEAKAVTGKNAEVTKYWFTLGFENQETVCALIANGDSGLTIGAQLVWDAQENDVIATADAEFVATWAAAVSANPNCYITYAVTGISEETPNFRVIPLVGGNGVRCAGEEMA